MFYKYKGQLIDLSPKIVGKAMGKETNESIAEYLRAQLVVGQRTGDNVVIDIGKLKPKWDELTINGVFEPNLTFNRTEWYKEENYLKFVKEEENHSIGGLNPGNYRLINESFKLNICSSADSEEELREQLKLIPNIEQFKKIIIQ